MEPPGPIERELKYSLVEPPPPAAAVVALGRGGPYAFVEAGTVTHLDRYFDDEAGRLRAAGLALRQRRVVGAGASIGGAGTDVGGAGTGVGPPGTIATLKTGGRVDGPWHRREEIEAPMHGDDWPVPVARRLAAHVALWQLRPWLELEVERSSYRVVFEGRAVATLVFDRVTARQPGVDRSAHFDEAEIEALAHVALDHGAPDDPRGEAQLPVLEGAAALLDEVVRLAPSSVTKLERAAAVLALGASL